MRISTGYQYDVYRADIQRAQSKYFDTQRQVTTGKRINTPSDDPQGTATLLNLRGLRSATEQYGKNLDTAKGFLGFSETALAETATLMSRAYQLALNGANGSTSQEGRVAMAAEVTQIQQRLVELGNTVGPSGQFIFGGQVTDSKPFSLVGSTLTFGGDSNDIRVEVSPSDAISVNVKGDALYTNAFEKLEELKTNLLGGDTARLSGVSVKDLQDSQRAFTEARGVVGTKLKTVEQLKDHATRRLDDFKVGISEVEEVDMAEAIMQYQLAETAYQAALTSVSQGSRLSLLDFMR